MSWYLKGYDYRFGLDGTRKDGGSGDGFFEPQIVNPQSGEELPQGIEHLLFWNTNGLAGERVTSTGQALRLLDVMEATVLRETWPKSGAGLTGVYLYNSAGPSQNGAGLSGVERAGIVVDANGPSIGASDITGFYLPNAMTLVTWQPPVIPQAENKNSIMQFLQKCRVTMLKYSSIWTV